VRLLRRGLVTVEGFHYKARSPDELDVWLTDERLARLWEITTRSNTHWRVKRNWRQLRLTHVGTNLDPTRGFGSLSTEDTLEQLVEMVEAMRWTADQPSQPPVPSDRRIVSREVAFKSGQHRLLKTAMRWTVGIVLGFIPAVLISIPFEGNENVAATLYLYLTILFAFLIARAMKRSSEENRWRLLYEPLSREAAHAEKERARLAACLNCGNEYSSEMNQCPECLTKRPPPPAAVHA
jgi:hypothetical protein